MATILQLIKVVLYNNVILYRYCLGLVQVFLLYSCSYHVDILMMQIPLLGSGVKVFFKYSEYTVRESAGRVAITIQAIRGYYYYHASFYVTIRASVSRHLNGNYTCD